MASLKNDRLLRAIRREPLDATPIWIMRQAGRYLPEYRATRAKAGSFMTLCQTPELACEVTLQPLRRYALDASIIFSDILTIPDAMGLGLSFHEGQGPVFAHPVQTEAAIKALQVPDLAKLQYVYDAISLVQRELAGKIPLLGFTGSPWTLAAYMVEGKSKNGFPLIKKMLQAEPQLLHHLLGVLAEAVVQHLYAQIKAGADVAMIFDTWGGMLSDADYQTFSLQYVTKIIQGLRALTGDNATPIILFTKGGGKWLTEMAGAGCDVVGLDWTMPLGQARAEVGHKVALQGNLNPEHLRLSPSQLRVEVEKVLASYGAGSGHIFNLGHGITPDIDPEQVSVLVDAVHELSAPYHQLATSGVK